MIIRRQPIIPWILDAKKRVDISEITIPLLADRNSHYYLIKKFAHLKNIHDANNPKWGVPMLTLPAYEDALAKCAIDLREDDFKTLWSKLGEGDCGIIMTEQFGTLIYGYYQGTLYVWAYQMRAAKSILYLNFEVKASEENVRNIYLCPNLIKCTELFDQSVESRGEIYNAICNYILLFQAMRKSEIQVAYVLDGKTVRLEPEGFDFNDRFRNESTHPILAVDSRLFCERCARGDFFEKGIASVLPEEDSQDKIPSQYQGKSFEYRVSKTEEPKEA